MQAHQRVNYVPSESYGMQGPYRQQPPLNWDGTCRTNPLYTSSAPRFASQEMPHSDITHRVASLEDARERGSLDDAYTCCYTHPNMCNESIVHYDAYHTHQTEHRSEFTSNQQEMMTYHHANIPLTNTPPSAGSSGRTCESAFSCDSICHHEIRLEAELASAKQSIAELKQVVAEQQQMLEYFRQHIKQMSTSDGYHHPVHQQHQHEHHHAQTTSLPPASFHPHHPSTYPAYHEQRQQREQQHFNPHSHLSTSYVHHLREYERLLLEREQMELHYRQLIEQIQSISNHELLAMKERNALLRNEQTNLQSEASDLRRDIDRLKRTIKTRNESRARQQQFSSFSPSQRTRKRGGKRLRRFICEAEIIQNLIRSQMEFYFSARNLRKDKQLLHRIIDGRFGFLTKEEVLNLPRIKPIGSVRKHFVAAIESSKVLVLTADDWVGCPNFVLPDGDEFPFRRSVFLFGLARKDEQLVRSILQPFGDLLRIEFSDDLHGPELDRKIAKRLLSAPFVTQLQWDDSTSGANFSYSYNQSSEGKFVCRRCEESTELSAGFYRRNGSSEYRICLNCAAIRAEEQIGLFKKDVVGLPRDSSDYATAMEERLGQRMAPDFAENTVTALAVFSSQRQTSKCVFVRSRLPLNGAMVVHYHHYIRLKKDIALSTSCEYKNIGDGVLKNTNSGDLENDIVELVRPKSTPCLVSPIQIPVVLPQTYPRLVTNVSRTSLPESVDTTTTGGGGPPMLIEDCDSEINGCSPSFSVSPRQQDKFFSSSSVFRGSLEHLCHDVSPFLTKPDLRRVMTAPVTSAQQVYMQSGIRSMDGAQSSTC